MSRRTLISFGVFWAVTFFMHIWFPEILTSFLQFFVDIESVSKDPLHSDDAGTNRWVLWKAAVEQIGKRPIFGFGNEGIGEALLAVGDNNRPHNEFLQYAAFYGIPAAVLYICGIMSVFLKAYRHRATLDASSLICLIAAFAYLFSSLFGNTMFYTAPFLFLFLGMGYGLETE
jgi:O-antigen ligase